MKEIKFKSTLEKDVYLQLKAEFINSRYENEKFNYTIPESDHTYTPDFKVRKIDKGIMYLECKGVGPRYGLTVQCRRKMLLVKEQYPYVDFRFIFWNAYATLGKGLKSTKYWEWAEQKGFKWCHKKIPKEWFREMGGK